VARAALLAGRAQGLTPFPELQDIAPNGGPPSTPALREMLLLWRQVATSVDPWLDELTTGTLAADLGGPGGKRTVADSIQRVTYHYWFHIGEILAICQQLGHRRLPEFVGDIDSRAPWRPDPPGV
jgi:hypothetical protein